MNDQKVAAWIPTVNRGVPAWESLSASTRAWWRDRYAARHGQVVGGKGANGA